MAATLNPYISFKNSAKDAIEFYQSVFGGDVNAMTFGQMGAEDETRDLIMHAMLTTPSGFTLMASDSPSEEYPLNVGNNIQISLSGTESEELRGYFEKLSEGGQVTMPLAKQVWGDEFGMLTDKFGIGWLVNISAGEQQA